MSVKTIDAKSFKEVEKSDKAIVEFYADWCGPCKMLAPVFEEVSEKLKGVDFFRVDGDKEMDLAEKFDVMSFPTMVLLEKGKEKDRMIGAANEESLTKDIKEKFGL